MQLDRVPGHRGTEAAGGSLAQQALAAYGRGRYEEAAALYQRAYDAAPDPALLVNLGRAHLKLGNAKQAIVYLKLYLSLETNPDPFVQDEVRKDITRARQIEAQRPGGPGTSMPAGWQAFPEGR